MWVTRKPLRSMASMMALGGAAPPVAISTAMVELALHGMPGAFASMFRTIGAPHIWVTPWRLISGIDQRGINLAAGRHGCRRPRSRPR